MRVGILGEKVRTENDAPSRPSWCRWVSITVVGGQQGIGSPDHLLTELASFRFESGEGFGTDVVVDDLAL